MLTSTARFPLLIIALVLISALLSPSFPQGYGRKIQVMRHHEPWNYPVPSDKKDSRVIGREMMEMQLDYQEPGANTNPRNGGIFGSPPPIN